MENNEINKRKLTLDDLMQVDENGVEFWFARDLMELLGYTKWQNFEVAIKRAMVSAESSESAGQNHFAEISKMVELGSGARREIKDYMLTRYACYLIAMNGDTRKQESTRPFDRWRCAGLAYVVRCPAAAGSIRNRWGQGNPLKSLAPASSFSHSLLQVVVQDHYERHQRAYRDHRVSVHRPHPLSGMPPAKRSTARGIVPRAVPNRC